jgi:hypothetical protein
MNSSRNESVAPQRAQARRVPAASRKSSTRNGWSSNASGTASV